MFMRQTWWWPSTWWRHQMEIFSALLAVCAGNSPVTDEFPAQRPVTRSFDVFFDLRTNQQFSKQWRRWSFEILPRSSWRYRNATENQLAVQPQRILKHGISFTFYLLYWPPSSLDVCISKLQNNHHNDSVNDLGHLRFDQLLFRLFSTLPS